MPPQKELSPAQQASIEEILGPVLEQVEAAAQRARRLVHIRRGARRHDLLRYLAEVLSYARDLDEHARLDGGDVEIEWPAPHELGMLTPRLRRTPAPAKVIYLSDRRKGGSRG